MGADAKVTVDADASAVDRVFGEMKAGAKSAASEMVSSLGNAAKSVALSLGDIVTSAGKVNFASQHSQVQAFEASTARLAVSAGRDLEGVRSEFEATGKAIGKRPAEVAAWSNEVGRLTYNFDGASKSMKGMSALAATTGRSVEDYRGLAVELHNVGAVAGDTTNVIGVMAAQAEKFGNAGGIAAFADQIEGLGSTISMFSIKSEADFTKVTALAGELGKGLSPQAAQRVQQTAFGSIAADPLRWERYLGKSITDEQGHVQDPSKVLQEITEKTKKRYGQDSRRVLMLNFGAEAGAAMYNANYSEAARAAGLGPSATPEQRQKEFLATDAGKRAQAESKLDESSRALMGSSTKLGAAADAMQRFAASNPITSTVVAGALSSGAATGLGALGKILGGPGGGGGIAGKIGLGGAGGALALGGAALAAGLYGIQKFDEAGEQRHQAEEDAGVAVNRHQLMLKAKTQKERVARLEAGGLSHGEAVFTASNASKEQLGAQMDPRELYKAVKDGMKDAKIVNMTSPVEVAAQSSQSTSSGNQSGG